MTERFGWFSALAPTSLREGAVISYSGDFLVASGSSIVEAVAARLAGPAAAGGWLTDGVPLLARGDVWIIPLSWNPHADDADREARLVADRRRDLWAEIRSACEYSYGWPAHLDVEGAPAVDAYRRELVRTGVRRADWWEIGDRALVLAVYGELIPAAVQKMALHVIPRDWVSEHPRTRARPPADLDLSWQWSELIGVPLTVEAVRSGAVLAATGRDVIEVLRRALDGANDRADVHRRLADALPLLSTAGMSVIPLAWCAPELAEQDMRAQQLRQRAEWLRQDLRRALDAPHPLAATRTGDAEDRWLLGEFRVDLVTREDPPGSAPAQLALHVIALSGATARQSDLATSDRALTWTGADAVAASSPDHRPADRAR